jgi:hypothetical protein
MRVLVCCLLAGAAIALPAATPQARAQPETGPATLSVYAPKLDGLARLSPGEIFESDEVLVASVDQIGRLGRRETEALARMLADCREAPTTNALADGYCWRARGYFEIVAAPFGPLGFLFAALGARFTWTKADWQRTDSAERARVIRRITRIEGAWGAAVHARLLALDREPR